MVVDKEKEAQRLEMEMQKRRERIEKWRAEKRKKEIENAKNEAIEAAKDVVEGSVNLNPIVAAAKQRVNDAKKWSLEDDEDEDENGAGGAGGADGDDEEEEDPLDAYMAGISKEVKKLKGPKGVVKSKSAAATASKAAATAAEANGGADGKKKGGVVIMMGVAKKKEEPSKGAPRRGELIEQNQDGLEYSSEGEKEEDLDDHMQKIANKGKKDIAKIDHNKIEYIDFQKDFYREVPELAKMTDGEVEEYRLDMDGIKVKGKMVPKPIKSWPQCGVSARILEILKRNNFEKPTPIQAQAIPVIMSGRDMIGIAKTGSGKTLAFLLPLFRHIAAQPELEEGDGPIAIIMTPTRELCTQIGREVKKFLRALKGVRCVCVYGGTTISEQIAELKRGAEIIVCTPGRMIEMLAANSGKVTNTHRVTYVVLDEADRMFGEWTKFGQMLVNILELFLRTKPLQTELFFFLCRHGIRAAGHADHRHLSTRQADGHVQCHLPEANGGSRQEDSHEAGRGGGRRQVNRVRRH